MGPAAALAVQEDALRTFGAEQEREIKQFSEEQKPEQ